MFDKVRFANIIKKIKETYSNQEEFAKKSEIGRTYLSLYMNMKLEEPPKPKILQKLAAASNNITNYNELMVVCGYMDSKALEIEILDELQSQLEENFLEILNSIKLSHSEEKIYNDLVAIIDLKCFDGLSENQIHKKLFSYLTSLDYISDTSKDKIEKKLFFFMQYCIQTRQIYEKVSSLALNTTDFKSNLLKQPQFYMCPVYGRISAGQPNWAEECIEGKLPIDPELMGIVNPEEHFFLRVNGESMNNIVKNGAFALIHKQEEVENGEIAVVLINGYDATLKRFTKKGDVIILEPDSRDESFKIQVYDKNTSIKILGKYVGKMEINK